MPRLLSGLALSIAVLFAAPAFAQGMGPDPARAAARDQCRQETMAQGLRGPARRDAMRACVQSRMGPARMQRQAENRSLRMNCRDQGRARGLRGPAMRDHMMACVGASRPDLARTMACRQRIMAQGLQPRTPEFRVAMRQCRAG